MALLATLSSMSSIVSGIGPAFQMIGQIAGKIFGAIKDFIMKYLVNPIKDFFEGFKGFLGDVKEKFGDLLGWIAEKFDAPMFDSQILTYDGIPLNFLPEQEFYVRESFAFETIQFNPYYNIWMASKLAQDTFKKSNGDTYTTFRDWNSSKFCWGNEKVFERKWRNEGF